MIICPHCGRENEDHYKFCLGCGSQLPKAAPAPVAEQPKMIHCPHCSTMVPNNFKFCGACGGPIAGFVDAQPAANSGVPPAQPQAAAPEVAQPEAAPPPLPGSPPPGEATSQMNVSNFSQPPAAATPQAASAIAKLVVIRPDGTEGAQIPLYTGEAIIGRESEHDVLSSDPFLSPQHASVVVNGGDFVIKDLDSLNGVFYRIQSDCTLENGDYIRMGQELLVYNSMESDDVKLPAGNEQDTLNGGSPDVGYWGRLSLISGPDIVARSYALSNDEISLGRERGDILFRDDGFVSGLHARISKNNGSVKLTDLQSSNGTYVRIRGERTLAEGDLVLMGQQLFRLMR